MYIQHKYDVFPEKAAGPGHYEWNSARGDGKRDRRSQLQKQGDTERKCKESEEA